MQIISLLIQVENRLGIRVRIYDQLYSVLRFEYALL